MHCNYYLESSSQPQNGEMNKKNEDSDEYEVGGNNKIIVDLALLFMLLQQLYFQSDRVSFSSSSSSSDAEDFTEASEESTKTMKKFVGWECKTLKPQAAPISRALVEKEGEEVTFRESRKTQNFHGTVGDVRGGYCNNCKYICKFILYNVFRLQYTLVSSKKLPAKVFLLKRRFRKLCHFLQ